MNELQKLIDEIKVVEKSRSLSDEYLEENKYETRKELDRVCEWRHGIVYVEVGEILPYLEKLNLLLTKV